MVTAIGAGYAERVPAQSRVDHDATPDQMIKVPPAAVALSTSSVYPETTSSAFELARRLGYDGVELMVGIDPVAADIDAVEKLRDYHGVPVVAVHAPCLLITQRVWGSDPWEKLERSAEAARRLDANVVVVHPPFRWQREYARGFIEGIKRLTESTGITFCVENMYPWRTPGGELKAYLPGWDPTERDYADLTLDFSHASTANQQSLDLARAWGDRLKHIHLTDGTGSAKDEHLVPGRGDQQAAKVLSLLAERDFSGHVVLEINSRKCQTRAAREADLAESLAFTRLHLAAAVTPSYSVDRGGVASAL
jgi:sugar phosphate isomerase/epimerase